MPDCLADSGAPLRSSRSGVIWLSCLTVVQVILRMCRVSEEHMFVTIRRYSPKNGSINKASLELLRRQRVDQFLAGRVQCRFHLRLEETEVVLAVLLVCAACAQPTDSPSPAPFQGVDVIELSATEARDRMAGGTAGTLGWSRSKGRAGNRCTDRSAPTCRLRELRPVKR